MYRKTFSDFKKTLDNDIRTIIHKGKNVACYKFPWFQTILTFAEEGKTHINKEQLSNSGYSIAIIYVDNKILNFKQIDDFIKKVLKNISKNG